MKERELVKICTDRIKLCKATQNSPYLVRDGITNMMNDLLQAVFSHGKIVSGINLGCDLVEVVRKKARRIVL